MRQIVNARYDRHRFEGSQNFGFAAEEVEANGEFLRVVADHVLDGDGTIAGPGVGRHVDGAEAAHLEEFVESVTAGEEGAAGGLPVSALTGEGIAELLAVVERRLMSERPVFQVELSGQGVALLEGGAGTAARPPKPTRPAASSDRGRRFEVARPARADNKQLPEIAALIDALCSHRVHVEEWIPKAGLDGHTLDLRVVVIDGTARQIVARLSRSPMTNLHLLNERGDPAAVRERRRLARTMRRRNATEQDNQNSAQSNSGE